ncbi:MAG: signal peptidase II [Acidimicrobiia bacterium]|nr:signal peptidase II [Acidimicrobiales bacterium]NNL47339.1 signal peptidase II [Acidimicrobiia bacterium]NNL98823.1 signal peptidase II [Acidimicrobiia bacterium]
MTESERSPGPDLTTVAAIAAIAFGIDVVSKIIGTLLLVDRSISLGPVTFHLVRNAGFVLGLGSNVPSWLVVGFTVAVTGLVMLMTRRGVFGGPAAGLVIGGAVANIVDRAIDGTVVDMIHVGRWPTFNLADAFILFGFFLLMSEDSRTRGVVGQGSA